MYDISPARGPGKYRTSQALTNPQLNAFDPVHGAGAVSALCCPVQVFLHDRLLAHQHIVGQALHEENALPDAFVELRLLIIVADQLRQKFRRISMAAQQTGKCRLPCVFFR